MEKITSYLIQSTVSTSEVRAWEEDIMLPTYEIGKEEKNPIFLEKRVYQGSSGSVYPYPVVEKISDEKKDKLYHALFIENEYIKVMILPELGGRIHMAYDKVKQRHFVYYNQVVKPALVGLTGPWISGGIEFNWPQHHRPSTFLPTDFSIEEHADGSKTVWCNEVERMFRTKGMQGFTLYPGKAYIEINVKIYNRTSFPQTFLWWANPAVVVNDHYHSVFPPDVNAVFDHGKRDVSSFPIATGVYYKQDYSAGVDISKYKNIPVPTSYMAIKSKFDFVGGVDRRVAIGKPVVIGPNQVPGVIGLKAIHLTTKEERKKVPKTESLYIDIGAKDKESAEKLVELGDCGAFVCQPEKFGGGLFKARAIDDRVGCAVMLKLLEEDLPLDVTFAFTAQEEVGTRGAFGAAFSVTPEIALVLETTTAADLPGVENHRRVCAPGKGPVISYMDGATIYDRELSETLRRLSEENGIPWQTKEYIAGGNDARTIQRTKAGVRVAALSAAVRYLHAPASVGSVADFENMLQLTRLFLDEMARRLEEGIKIERE